MNKTITLSESQLRNLIKESVKRILGETEEFDWSSLDKPADLDALAMLKSRLDVDAKNNPRQKRVYDDDPEWNEFIEQDLEDRRNGRYQGDTYTPIGGEYDPYEKFLDNEISWEQHPINEPGEGEIDHYIGQNNNRLYGDEYQKDNVGKKARDKWVGGASPDYMEGWTDAALGESIKKTVRNVINEIKADDPHENLRATNDALEVASNNIGGLEDALAELMVDNNLTFEDVKQYDNLMRFIDPQQLDQEIDRYKNFLEQDRLDDKRREAQAWAEDQMSDMGFGYEGD